MQLINVACGGTLLQHLPERFGHHEHRRVVGSFDGADHDVVLDEGSLAARVAGEARARDQVPPPPGRRPARRGPASSAASRRSTSCPRRSSCPTGASCSACSGTPRPTRRARSSARWWPALRADAPRAGARSAAEAPPRAGRAPARPYTAAPSAAVQAIRATAWGVVAAGVAAPLVRKRVQRSAARHAGGRLRRAGRPVRRRAPLARARRRRLRAADVGLRRRLQVAARRPRARRQQRVHIDYPIVADRVLGLGELPTVRLQRALARAGADGPRVARARPRARVGALGWFLVPHGSLAYILLRHPRALPARGRDDLRGVRHRRERLLAGRRPRRRGTRPTAAAGRASGEPAVRRMMVEYGEIFWGDGWGSLYSVFGGNPLAAMPSLHFATSVMAALLLAEVGPVAGALGFGYAATLGFALVYLGEHYVVDLLAGAALTAAVRRLGPRAGPAARRASGARSRRWRRWHTRRPEEEGVSAQQMAPASGRGAARRRELDGDALRRRRGRASAARGGDAARARSRAGRSSPSALFILSASPSCTSCCRSSPGVGHDACTASRAATSGGSRSASCSSCSRSPATSCCSARCSSAATARIGWRESYEITMAGPRRDAPVRGRRRRRRRADRVGAAPLGHGAAAGRLPDGRLHRAAVRRSTRARC